MKKRQVLFTFSVLSLLGTGCIFKKKEIKTQKNQAELRSINSNGINSDNLLDINDVSILFTKEIGSNSSRVYPSIPVTSKIEGQKTWPLAKDPSGAQGTIWEKNLFDEVIRLAGTQDTQVKNSSGRRANNFQISFFNPPSIDAWRIVGFRFIPCVLTSKVIETGVVSIPSPGCVTQIRLIAQPMDSANNNDLEDIAVHLVYSFDLFPTKAQTSTLLAALNAQLQTPNLPDAAKAAISQQIGLMQRFDASAFNTRLEVAKAIAAHPQIGPMIADLQKIKEVTKTLVNTNGRPLGAHPGLVAEVQKGANSSQPGPIAQSIQSFLTNHLSSFHLSNISFMGLNNGGPEPWLFFGGDMGLAATGPATPTFVQTAIGREWIPHKNLTYRLKGVFPSEQPPRPEKAIALSFITNDAVIPAPKAVGHLAGLFGPNDVIDSNPAHMVDNPNLIHNFNADCVSCHVGTTRMNTLTQADNLTLTAKATDPNRFKTVPGISGYVDPAFMSLTQWNVRNFGFFAEANDPEARPKVTFRVLNESIDSTELTNQAIFSVANDDLSALKHPGLTCPDDNGVWTCALTNARDCFSSCNVAKTNEPAPAPIASPKVGDGDGKRPNPGGQDPVPNNPPATCNLTTSPAQVRGPNGNVIFTAKAGVSLSMVTMPNTPQGSIGVAVDIFVRDDLLTCDPNELCRAFPEPAPNTDQKDALLPIHFNNNGAKGADLGTAKNAAFLGTLKPTADRKNRTGVISGFVSSTSCK